MCDICSIFSCCLMETKSNDAIETTNIYYNNDTPTINWGLSCNKSRVLVIDVYDGDTITVIIPLVLNVYSFNEDNTNNIVCIKNNINENNNIKFYKLKIRMYGIDTPELKPKLNVLNREDVIQKAKIARDYLKNLILNKHVDIIFEKCVKNDPFNRHLASIYFDGENINEKMVKEGYAIPYFGEKKNENVFSN